MDGNRAIYSLLEDIKGYSDAIPGSDYSAQKEYAAAIWNAAIWIEAILTAASRAERGAKR